MQHRQALPIGTYLHEYEVLDVLGSGGFGVVYLAQDHALAQRVVIKEYLPAACAVRLSGNTVVATSPREEATFRWGLERFLAEARALAEFRQHPNIVSVLRHFNANNTGYMVMEYAGALSLQDYLDQRQTLSEAQLEAMILPLLDALEKVHARGIIHRDLKPANILINAEGQPVLIDFGAARQALEHKSQSMTAIITPGYSPFEQYTATGKQGAWTDIYALAAVMYRCVTGSIPPDALGRMIPAAPALVTAEQVQGTYSPALLAAIDWGLQVQVEARPASIAQWRERLSAVDAPETAPTLAPQALRVKSAPGVAASAARLPRFSQPVGKRRQWGILLLSAMLLLGVGMLWYAQVTPTAATLPVQASVTPAPPAEPIQPVTEPRVMPASIREAVVIDPAKKIEAAVRDALGTAVAIRDGLAAYKTAQTNLGEIRRLRKQSEQADKFKGNREEFERLVEERTAKNQRVLDEHAQRLARYREQVQVLCPFRADTAALLAGGSRVTGQGNLGLIFRHTQRLCTDQPLSDTDLTKDLAKID